MKNIMICVVMMVSLLFAARSEKNEAPIKASSYSLVEAETGTVLEQSNGDKQMNPGYLTKLMSLLLIAEDIETGKYTTDTLLTASGSVTGTKGAVVWLEQGDPMTVDELLKSVIIGNANDALTVLAEASQGTVEKFVMRMNSEAFDLGLRNTAFYSPYGYYDSREVTTANDLAKICAELSRYEQLLPYFTTWRDFVREGGVELVSENTLARTYQRHIGFKACHSEQSGYCAAEGARSENGTTFIAVVLGADDGESLAAVKNLCNKGFSEYKVTATMFPDEMLMPVKVKGGIDLAVPVRLADQSTLVVPKGVGELKTVVVIPDFVSAPVEKGQILGMAAFYNGKTLVYESDIIADDDVKLLSYAYVLKKMLSNVSK